MGEQEPVSGKKRRQIEAGAQKRAGRADAVAQARGQQLKLIQDRDEHQLRNMIKQYILRKSPSVAEVKEWSANKRKSAGSDAQAYRQAGLLKISMNETADKSSLREMLLDATGGSRVGV